MKKLGQRSASYIALVAMLGTALPAVPANAQNSSEISETARLNQEEAAKREAARAAAQAAAVPAIPENETKSERKARLKAEKKARKSAEKERKRLAKEERKRQKAAEREARRKSGKRNGLVDCAIGAGVGILGALLLGGKKKGAGRILGGAALGCAAGYGLGQILSKRDQEQLTDYVENDYALRDDVNHSTFTAAESGHVVSLSKSQTTMEQADHKFLLDEEVDFDGSNIQVNERYMRATSSLRMRGSPTIVSDNIVGGFAPNDIVRTYGTTSDGQWTHIVEKQADGSYKLLGYVSSRYLSTSLQKPRTVRVATAKPKPVKRKSKRKAAPRKIQASRPVKTASFRATTACKSMKMSAGGKTGGSKNCGGAKGLAFNTHNKIMGAKA